MSSQNEIVNIRMPYNVSIISVWPGGVRFEAHSKSSQLTGTVETAIRLNQAFSVWCVNEMAVSLPPMRDIKEGICRVQYACFSRNKIIHNKNCCWQGMKGVV